MKKILLFSILQSYLLVNCYAQVDAGLFRYPDVSKDQIVFTYANDIWIIPKEGGTAIKLSSPPGVESFPKFSPDGRSIAFSCRGPEAKHAAAIAVAGENPRYHAQWHPRIRRLLNAP